MQAFEELLRWLSRQRGPELSEYRFFLVSAFCRVWRLPWRLLCRWLSRCRCGNRGSRRRESHERSILLKVLLLPLLLLYPLLLKMSRSQNVFQGRFPVIAQGSALMRLEH